VSAAEVAFAPEVVKTWYEASRNTKPNERWTYTNTSLPRRASSVSAIDTVIAANASTPVKMVQPAPGPSRSSAVSAEIVAREARISATWPSRSVNAVSPVTRWTEYMRSSPPKRLSTGGRRAPRTRLTANAEVPASASTTATLVRLVYVVAKRASSGAASDQSTTGVAHAAAINRGPSAEAGIEGRRGTIPPLRTA
jgi:hypothetical protein